MPLLLMWQESESEEDILDEGDDDDDLEEEHETQVHPEAETEVKKAPEVPAPPKEPERQLSKKELKQKEQAEFDALLADFGVGPNNGQENSQDKQEKERRRIQWENQRPRRRRKRRINRRRWEMSPWGYWYMTAENETHMVELEARTNEARAPLRAPTSEAG
ncbi:hypothetical protein Bca52824_089542 [Brassica carinata]|uniref:Uncharacterized protein n=1 Tax=Brassica carinata TaxID=52824 RepID=A0A8X7TQA5_BRACI|nr:hypothetical protein Bca52824_089542 [Brassica carinata]